MYHLYVIRVQIRDNSSGFTSYNAHIGTGIHYPIPLHLQKAYRSLGYKEGDFPVAEKAAREILSLPMYPQLRCDQQQRVASAVKDFMSAEVSVAGLK